MANTDQSQATDSVVASLLNEMKRTKGARFNAAKRLEIRGGKRTANTAYASVAVVVLTLLPVFFQVPELVEKTIALTTIAFSIFILASSLLQSAHADPVKADQFQRCALEINSLRRELRAISRPTNSDVTTYSVRFDDILRRYNINHDDVDNEKYRLEHPDEFPKVTAKDTEIARKEVRNESRVLDVMRLTIVVATALLAVASTVPITQLADLLRYFGNH
ncbi:SLATT domain-containing protein [Mesorhizobium sp. BR1-1-9]|uniref:SLATT domain-containing protein n=1 Tax=unclassified Mesorhizobium TaxID=325217 RepID=UPI001CD16DB0|nr:MULTISPECIES: SLATT domain-containing protein [unclassified Mesorhizobium]MBZ9871878.1 SLATT domain-containing protein [Mesorhizobium sp. BR1-1-9]MBZ9944384.1 SLATT domain-containing protein [Mesorhizobium sp. BR1-1-13]